MAQEPTEVIRQPPVDCFQSPAYTTLPPPSYTSTSDMHHISAPKNNHPPSQKATETQPPTKKAHKASKIRATCFKRARTAATYALLWIPAFIFFILYCFTWSVAEIFTCGQGCEIMGSLEITISNGLESLRRKCVAFWTGRN